MVMSKFCTFTVVRPTSSTVPLILRAGTVIQSPGRSMSLSVSCTPATTPIIESLNTSMSTVAAAPRPVITVSGFLSARMEIMMITPTETEITWSICLMPLSEEARPDEELSISS